MVLNGCTEACTAEPDCKVCGRVKMLRGRSYPLEMCGGRCNDDCHGYYQEPMPGHVWPEEWRAHLAGDHTSCYECGGDDGIS